MYMSLGIAMLIHILVFVDVQTFISQHDLTTPACGILLLHVCLVSYQVLLSLYIYSL